MKLILLSFMVWATSSGLAFAEEHSLIVNLTGVKNSSGDVYVELYSDPKTFRKSALASNVIKAKAQEGTVTIKFTGVSPGVYAILAFHDEDGNGLLNKRFGMIPTEGYALSNNPDVFGPPAFKDSEFEVISDKELTIPMHY